MLMTLVCNIFHKTLTLKIKYFVYFMIEQKYFGIINVKKIANKLNVYFYFFFLNFKHFVIDMIKDHNIKRNFHASYYRTIETYQFFHLSIHLNIMFFDYLVGKKYRNSNFVRK